MDDARKPGSARSIEERARAWLARAKPNNTPKLGAARADTLAIYAAQRTHARTSASGVGLSVGAFLAARICDRSLKRVRAAFVTLARLELPVLLAELAAPTSDLFEGTRPPSQSLAEMAQLLEELASFDERRGGPGPPPPRLKHQSLPADWRHAVARHLPTQHLPAFLVLAVSGARPAELRRGIDVVSVARSDGMALRVRVDSAKVDAIRGQPFRELTFPVQPGSLAARLFECMAQSHVSEMRIASKSTRGLADALARTGRLLWPGHAHLSPYDLRYTFADDLRRAGFTSLQVAAALGHRSDQSHKSYTALRKWRGGRQRETPDRLRDLTIEAPYPISRHTRSMERFRERSVERSAEQIPDNHEREPDRQTARDEILELTIRQDGREWELDEGREDDGSAASPNAGPETGPDDRMGW